MRRSLVAFAFFAVSLPALAQAQTRPAISWTPASSSNYRNSSGRNINMIVIHKAEGSLNGTVSWFRNSSARVSAHYTVDASQICQSVDDSDIAWHAGNGDYNARSIGIENAGYTYRNDVSDAHYRRLASLVAYLCAKYRIPADRSHIIGHAQVPNPNRPGRFGGSGGHEDPGPYFNWSLFMSYVQQANSSGGITVPSAPPTPRPAPQPGNGGARALSINVDLLNVRDAAWGTVVSQVAAGSGFVRTGRTSQGFAEIYFRGTTGWVSEQYTAGLSTTGAHIDASTLNVRDGAGLGSTVIGEAYKDQVYCRGDISSDGTWELIRFDRFRRWVYRAYTHDVTLSP